MKFFLDENFPKSVGRFLEELGHEVVDIRSTEHEGSDDKEIFEFAQAKEAIFLTTDRDFFHTAPHLYKEHHGIVVVALKQPNRRQIQIKMEWLLQNHKITEFKNHVLLLRDQHFTKLPK